MTTPPEIPEAISRAALKAGDEEDIDWSSPTKHWDYMRAALEAAAPSLRAQGMEKAITAMTDDDPDDILPPIMLQAVDAIRRAHAAEIEKVKP